MKSSWDLTKSRSNYHFSNEILDPRYDTVISLGRILGNWSEEVQEIIKNSSPATWATRGYKKAGAAIPSEDLATEEYDVDRVGGDSKKPITNLNWQIPAVLQQISNLFALKDCMNRIHVQMPGQMWNMHLDKLEKWCPQDPDSVMRIMIHLTDWQQGQFWNYGNYIHQGWKSGDVTTFDWKNVPHSTANAGHHPRVTFQLTGVITEKTKAFLSELKSTTEYQL
jgi:hypothetical protein